MPPAKPKTERADGTAAKGSARSRSGPVAKDDILTGTVGFTEKSLRAAVEGKTAAGKKRREEILALPDDDPIKVMYLTMVAEVEREKKAAPLVTKGAQLAKDWEGLHGKAATVTRDLARVLVELRAIYPDKQGNPDLLGRSYEYRQAAARIYDKAGIPSDSVQHIQANVRYHLSDVLRGYMKEIGRDKPKDFEYYGINPLSANERRKVVTGGDEGGALVPVEKFPTPTVLRNDPSKAVFGIVRHVRSALEVAPPEKAVQLDDDQREELMEQLEAVRDKAEALMELYGHATGGK